MTLTENCQLKEGRCKKSLKCSRILLVHVNVHVKSRHLCSALCSTVDCSLPGSSVYGLFQARILEWVAIFLLLESSRPMDQTHISCISCIGRQILYHCTTWEDPYQLVWMLKEHIYDMIFMICSLQLTHRYANVITKKLLIVMAKTLHKLPNTQGGGHIMSNSK